MKKAEMQYDIIRSSDGEINLQSVNVHKTLEHLVEVINEMQDALTPPNTSS